jgi:hypothetical protein
MGFGLLAAVAIAIQSLSNNGIPFEAAHRMAVNSTNAAWMEDHLPAWGGRKLSQLVLPASHDAGLYQGGPLGWGQTQCLSIYDQLRVGVRWFDLRPKWVRQKFVIYHGPIAGPDLAEVLADLRKFASQEHHELIYLKLSHFEGIDDATYVQLTALLEDQLSPWVFTGVSPAKRLADITLSEYVQSGTKIIVLVDGRYARDHPAKGIWTYSDVDDPQVRLADLRVYDIYSDTPDFNDMQADQFAKFARYDGKCRDGATDCDLFLLSWTLTPRIKIWAATQPAIEHLRPSLLARPPTNSAGKVMNLIYADFAGLQDVTGVALEENERLSFGQSDQRVN